MRGFQAFCQTFLPPPHGGLSVGFGGLRLAETQESMTFLSNLRPSRTFLHVAQQEACLRDWPQSMSFPVGPTRPRLHPRPSSSVDNANRRLTKCDFLFYECLHIRQRKSSLIISAPWSTALNPLSNFLIPLFKGQYEFFSVAGTLRVHGRDCLFGRARLARRSAECTVILRLTGE